MNHTIRHVVIVGGGITGMTAAYYAGRYAADAGIPLKITVLEKSDRLGGKIHTLQKEGFTIEKGADSFLTRKQPLIELTRELGLEDRLVGQGSRGKRAFFLHHGQFHPAPAGMVLGIPTDLSAFMETGLVSPDGKARALEDQSLPRSEAEGDESLGGFLERRLGPEMVANVAEPLLAGIYAGDLYKLSLEATFPQFMEAERQYGSVIQGMQVAQANAKAQPSHAPKAAAGSAFLSYRDGLGTVISELERAVTSAGTVILRETYAVRIERAPGAEPGAGEVAEAGEESGAGEAAEKGKVAEKGRVAETGEFAEKGETAGAGEEPGTAEAGIAAGTGSAADTGNAAGYRVHLNRGDHLDADAVIITLPTYEYPGLLPHLPGLVKLSQLPYVSVANVVLAFDEADVPSDFEGSGFVISRREGRFITACTRTSLKWENTAPSGKALIRCYVGRVGDQDWVKLTDEEIAAKARREVRELLHIEAEPLFYEITRLYRSMPNYPVGHLEHIRTARGELAGVLPGVHLTGAAFHGVGLPDCVRQGRETAEAVVMQLKKGV